ncbi:GtrA family protein [Flammeovirgaceae bacterium SG7u.111]|nr:GtrA family protein [Flammeovirgaceae bacterium SG7u.132]WPO38419.1 GtrA family protein [Flammeovirgaceae bacterium SG7u.111]
MDSISIEFLKKFIKFGLVGSFGVVIDFGFTYLIKDVLKKHKYLANSVGFMLAASSNYILNRIWTFHDNNPDIALQYSKFLIISAIGLGINNFIIWVLNDKYKMNFYLAKLFAIGVVMLWNFFANYLYTFA